MAWLAKLKTALEWMRLAKFVGDMLVAIASWKMVRKLLTYVPQISEDWASIIAWFAAGLILIALVWWQQRTSRLAQDALITTAQREAGAPDEIISLQVTQLDQRATDPKIIYKAKLRLVFTNLSKQLIHVLPPTWMTGPDDVPVQYPLGYRYQTERSLGSWRRNEWNQQELMDAHIDPGWSFTVYIGLCQSVPHGDLEKRRSTRRLGTLMIPIKIGNQSYKWDERV